MVVKWNLAELTTALFSLGLPLLSAAFSGLLLESIFLSTGTLLMGSFLPSTSHSTVLSEWLVGPVFPFLYCLEVLNKLLQGNKKPRSDCLEQVNFVPSENGSLVVHWASEISLSSLVSDNSPSKKYSKLKTERWAKKWVI